MTLFTCEGLTITVGNGKSKGYWDGEISVFSIFEYRELMWCSHIGDIQ